MEWVTVILMKQTSENISFSDNFLFGVELGTVNNQVEKHMEDNQYWRHSWWNQKQCVNSLNGRIESYVHSPLDQTQTVHILIYWLYCLACIMSKQGTTFTTHSTLSTRTNIGWDFILLIGNVLHHEGWAFHTRMDQDGEKRWIEM